MTGYELNLRNEVIAKAYAGGASITDICIAHELTPTGFQELALDPAFVTQVERTRLRLQLSIQSNQQFLTTLVPNAINNLELILKDPNHKEWAKVSMDVVKLGLPQRTENSGLVGVQLKASDETMGKFVGLLTNLLESHRGQPDTISIDQDPRMIDQ